MTGFEPAAPCSQGTCSSQAELHPDKKSCQELRCVAHHNVAQGRTATLVGVEPTIIRLLKTDCVTITPEDRKDEESCP